MEGDYKMRTSMQEESTGPIIGTVIILAVIILGGLYFWIQRSQNIQTTPIDTTATSTPDSLINTQAIEAQSSADDTASIEKDLNSTDTTTIDSSLNTI